MGSRIRKKVLRPKNSKNALDATEYPGDNEHAPEFHVTVSDLKAIACLNKENCRLKEEEKLKEKRET